MLDILFGRKKFYCVNVHGEGILISNSAELVLDHAPDEPIIGFYALRTVKTNSPQEAIAEALSMLTNQWQQEKFTSINHGTFPRFTVEEVNELSIWDGVRRGNSGHLFYGPDKE